MKKENVIINVIIKSMIGFPIGITLLILAYISVYFIAGENVFINEFSQLLNIKTLISQVLFSGIIWYLMFINFNSYIEQQNKELENKDYLKHLYKEVLVLIIQVFIVIILLALSLNTNIFSKNIETINLITIIIGYSLAGLYLCINFTKESHLIKEINKKIKEINS